MTDVESSQEPRRSQREKKQAAHFISGMLQSFSILLDPLLMYFIVDSTLIKRKRSDATTDDDAQSEVSYPESNHDDPEVEEDFRAPKVKPKVPAKGKRKAKGPPPAKKARTTKVPTAPKPAAKNVASKPRKPAARKAKQVAVDASEFDAEKVAKDTKIAGDNPLFSMSVQSYPYCFC